MTTAITREKILGWLQTSERFVQGFEAGANVPPEATGQLLFASLDILRLLLITNKELSDNLARVQARCTELLEETRRLKCTDLEWCLLQIADLSRGEDFAGHEELLTEIVSALTKRAIRFES